MRLTEGELVVICLGQKLLLQYAGTPYEAHIRPALEKIALLLPDEVSVELAQVDRGISFASEAARGDQELVALPISPAGDGRLPTAGDVSDDR